MYTIISNSFVIMDAIDISVKCNIIPNTQPIVKEGIKEQIAKYITEYNQYIKESDAREHITKTCDKIVSELYKTYHEYQVPGRINVWRSKNNMSYDDKLDYENETNQMKIDYFKKSLYEMIYDKVKKLYESLSDPIQKQYLKLGMDSFNEYKYQIFIPYPIMPESNRLILDYMDILYQFISSKQAIITKVSEATVSNIDNDIDHPTELTDSDPLVRLIIDLGMKYQINIKRIRKPKYMGCAWQDEIDRIGGDDDDRDVISVISTLTVFI